MNFLAPAISISILALGAYALWGLGIAVFGAVCTILHLPPVLAEPITVLGPICALLYCFARW